MGNSPHEPFPLGHFTSNLPFSVVKKKLTVKLTGQLRWIIRGEPHVQNYRHKAQLVLCELVFVNLYLQLRALANVPHPTQTNRSGPSGPPSDRRMMLPQAATAWVTFPDSLLCRLAVSLGRRSRRRLCKASEVRELHRLRNSAGSQASGRQWGRVEESTRTSQALFNRIGPQPSERKQCSYLPGCGQPLRAAGSACEGCFPGS